MQATINITDMSIEKKAAHMLEVLNHAEQNAEALEDGTEYLRSILIDAGYVIEQQRMEICRLNTKLITEETKRYRDGREDD